MKKTVVNGVDYVCPRYVVRVPNGWQTRLPGEASLFFGDVKHGGVSGSHAAAVDWRVQRLPITTEEKARCFENERPQKKHKLGVPGIYLTEKTRKNSIPQYELHVVVKGEPVRSIYVGTQNTWESRLPAKLDLAIQIRQEKMKIRTQKVAARIGAE